MVDILNAKFVQQIFGAAIVDDAYFPGSHQHGSPVSVDSLGFNNVTFLVALGATDIALAELSVYESNDDTTYVKIDATDFSVAAVGTLPSATDDNKLYLINISKVGGVRRRYFRVNAKGGNGSTGGFLTATAILTQAEQSPNSATERGVAQQAFV